ncbi:DUF1007 family protein [Martelella mediterranea]|uniref:ABC-type uncharacterized transport system, periplasmic component n=1 Tax=Martelella mediterranea DSM 17316 TaxID=1122214 RepID=A0A1U9YZD6_9HYPH|nr:DUF1007 family protein [Martelella mediterranea]AQZ50750.1 ABC-type uncharacterized transport system, periplasmic component [Martelella mediterranea DSM 17316]
MKFHRSLSIAALFCLAAASQAGAHPHVFVDARLEVVADDDGNVTALQNVWRFDEFFTSSVILDYDANMDNQLTGKELTDIGDTVRESLAEYGYYTQINDNGEDVPLAEPDVIHADMMDGQLLLIFSAKPSRPIKLSGHLTFGIYDASMYTAIDFQRDEDLAMIGDAFGRCKAAVVRPDPDEIISQNSDALTAAFFNDPTDMSKLFATRLDLTCPD